MKYLITCLSLLITFSLAAQNSYHRLEEINTTAMWVRGAVADGATKDTRLMIYQHGGATVRLSGAGTGQVEDLNGVGRYDLNKVIRVGGDTLFLEFPVTNVYDLSSSQIIRFESSDEVSINGEQMVSQAYDGSLGGVTFIAADNKITLEEEATLSVAEAGFRGGRGRKVVSDCNRFTSASGETYSATDWRGSARGEGIGNVPANQPNGRAPVANGGGGGNDHNAGGGGGANVAAGGNGAQSIVRGLFNASCRGNYPGRNGRGLEDEADRVYFGGGGGAGHANNTNTSRGGRGGGLLVLWAPSIEFTGENELNASGEGGTDIFGDGGGGGGGAGTILLLSDTLIGTPTLTLNGGQGGDVDNPDGRCFGPGGGGGGGRLISTASEREEYDPLISVSMGGFGLRLNSSECSQSERPAGPGEDGSVTDAELPVPFPGIMLSADTICSGNNILLTDLSQGATSVEWEILPATDEFTRRSLGTSLGLIFNDRASGTFTAIQKLLVDGVRYPGDTVSFTVLQGAFAAEASIDFDGATVVASLERPFGFTNIRYDFGDGTVFDTTALSITHAYDDIGSYDVSITLFNEVCGDVTLASQRVNVNEFTRANVNLKDAEGCAPLTVRVTDLSTGTFSGRVWNLPGGNPGTSTMTNPVVVYEEPGEYLITLTLLDGVGNDTIFELPVVVLTRPEADISVRVDTATAIFTNESIDGLEYNWDFGDDTQSTDAMPTHTYNATGTYTVTLIATNGTCTDTTTREVTIDVLSDVTDLIALGVKIFPNPTNGLVTLTGPARITGAFDLRGRIITPLGNRSLDLSGLPGGTYLVRVEAGGRIHHVRILKR